MNSKLSRKQNELNLLTDVLNNLKNCRVDRNLNNDNNFAGVTIENAIFNLVRVKDLINGIYD